MSAFFTLDISERTKMLQDKQREGLAEAARFRAAGMILPAVPISDEPIYFAGTPDPSQFVDLAAYMRSTEVGFGQVSPLESGCIAPQQSWIEPSVGYAQLGGHLQVPSTSAFGRALKPSDIQTPSEAGSLGFYNSSGAPVARAGNLHTDASILHEWVSSVYSDVLAARSPQDRKPGGCMLCGDPMSLCIAEHLLFGPHGGKWSRAVEDGGSLSIMDWRRLVVLVHAINLRDTKHVKVTGLQQNQMRWVFAQRDPLLWRVEGPDVPVFSLPRSDRDRVVAGLEFVIPFVGWLKAWAKENNRRIDRYQMRSDEARKARASARH